jgi:large subunit ribosomal protein L23
MAIFKKKTEQKAKQSEVPAKAGNQSAHAGSKHAPLLVRKPHVTEKTLRMAEQNSYVFIVPQFVSKTEAAKQIEKLYNVHCVHSRVTTGAAKKKYWRGKSGRTERFKKIIVTLKEGQKIEMTGNT